MEKKVNSKLLTKSGNITDWNNANPVLDLREMVTVVVPLADGTTVTLMKIGDGKTDFQNLPFISGLAVDVYEWAKKETLDVNDIPSLEVDKINGLSDILENKQLKDCVVNITKSTDNSITVDKTFEEICNAYNEGRNIYAVTSEGLKYDLMTIDISTDGYVVFSYLLLDGMLCCFYKCDVNNVWIEQNTSINLDYAQITNVPIVELSKESTSEQIPTAKSIVDYIDKYLEDLNIIVYE